MNAQHLLLKTIGLAMIAGSSVNCVGGDQLSPATCKDAKLVYHVSTDGPQTLYYQGDKSMPWPAFCMAMASDSPKEFLELEQHTASGSPANYSEFAELPNTEPAAGPAPGFHVWTHYGKVRIDPDTLAIDITNTSFINREFAPADGDHMSVALGQQIDTMPYGAAMECGYGLDATGQPVTANGNVDLTGLPLELAEPPLCNGIGSRAIPDPSSPVKIVDFHAIGGFTDSGVMCDRASVRCLPDPAVNGHVGGQTTLQLRYASAAPGS